MALSTLPLGPLIWNDFIPACICNYIYHNVWVEITYEFHKFHAEIWERTSNFTRYWACDYLSMLGYNSVSKGMYRQCSSEAGWSVCTSTYFSYTIYMHIYIYIYWKYGDVTMVLSMRESRVISVTTLSGCGHTKAVILTFSSQRTLCTYMQYSRFRSHRLLDANLAVGEAIRSWDTLLSGLRSDFCSLITTAACSRLQRAQRETITMNSYEQMAATLQLD